MQVPQQKQVLEQKIGAPDISIPVNIAIYCMLTYAAVTGMKHLILPPRKELNSQVNQQLHSPVFHKAPKKSYSVQWHNKELPVAPRLPVKEKYPAPRWESYKED